MTEPQTGAHKICPELMKAALQLFVKAAQDLDILRSTLRDGEDLPEGFEEYVKARAYNSGLMPELKNYVETLGQNIRNQIIPVYPPQELRSQFIDVSIFSEVLGAGVNAGALMEQVVRDTFR